MNTKEAFFTCVWLTYIVALIAISFLIASADKGASAIIKCMVGIYLAYETKSTFLSNENMEAGK